jgi:hypothetical protein
MYNTMLLSDMCCRWGANAYLVLPNHFIKLIYAADASVGQHHSPSLKE